MTDIMTVKDRYAAIIERTLRTASTSDYNEMAVEIVRALDIESLMCTDIQYRVSGVPEDESAKSWEDLGQVYSTIELRELQIRPGEYLLESLTTPWVRR